MHSYTVDSSEAISRILALTMIVDGHVSPSEVRAMHAATLLREVRIDDDTFDATLRQLCEDLLGAAAWRHAGIVEIEPDLIAKLLHEIRDPVLQLRLWAAMVDIVRADGHLDTRETLLVRHAAGAWFGQGSAHESMAPVALAG